MRPDEALYIGAVNGVLLPLHQPARIPGGTLLLLQTPEKRGVGRGGCKRASDGVEVDLRRVDAPDLLEGHRGTHAVVSFAVADADAATLAPEILAEADILFQRLQIPPSFARG